MAGADWAEAAKGLANSTVMTATRRITGRRSVVRPRAVESSGDTRRCMSLSSTESMERVPTGVSWLDATGRGDGACNHAILAPMQQRDGEAGSVQPEPELARTLGFAGLVIYG